MVILGFIHELDYYGISHAFYGPLTSTIYVIGGNYIFDRR